jgi:hypothetical protein
MANLATLQNDVKALTFRGFREHVSKQNGGTSVKEILAHYAPRFEVNLDEKKERDILYRRVNRLLSAGLETEEIQKDGSKFVVMTPEQAEAHRKAQAKLAKQRAEVSAAWDKKKLSNTDGSVTEQHVVLTFSAFLKLTK